MNRKLWMMTVVLAASFLACAARAQNPIQWSGNARTSIERAREMSLPLMFWVDQRANIGDDDDLRDAQEAAFRNPIVAWIAQQRFVPVRVSRNSRVLEECRALGLPTEFGLYVALVAPDGRVLAQISPGDVATPEALAERLAAASRTYRNELYDKDYKAIITSKEAPKEEVRRAVQAVWRLGMFDADGDVVALLDRPDLTDSERSRLYAMLASIATRPCIEALLARAAAGDRVAANAMAQAEPGALEWLIPELPPADARSHTERQSTAYAAVSRIASAGPVRPQPFWSNGRAEDREREMNRVRERAAAVREHWTENTGRWR